MILFEIFIFLKLSDFLLGKQKLRELAQFSKCWQFLILLDGALYCAVHKYASVSKTFTSGDLYRSIRGPASQRPQTSVRKLFELNLNIKISAVPSRTVI